uniref:Uncharacterized protein n=1 Tax=Phaeodactylum tricornutum TaxID=2850 RepID=A0A8J9THJ2_PHATR
MLMRLAKPSKTQLVCRV